MTFAKGAALQGPVRACSTPSLEANSGRRPSTQRWAERPTRKGFEGHVRARVNAETRRKPEMTSHGVSKLRDLGDFHKNVT